MQQDRGDRGAVHRGDAEHAEEHTDRRRMLDTRVPFHGTLRVRRASAVASLP